MGRRPHIMLVGHWVGPHVYGAERSLLDVLAAVDQQRFQLSCVLPGHDDEYMRAVAKHTAGIHVLPYAWWTAERPVDAASVEKLEALFSRERVDLVHVNTIALLDPLIAARKLGVPSVVHAREIITQSPELQEQLGDNASNIVRRVREAADFIIANSDATHRVYCDEGRGFRLYNSVDVDRFDLPNTLQPGKLRVGMISSSQPNKGVQSFVNLAIMASRSRPDLEFFMIGPHTDHTRLLEQIARAEDPPVSLHCPGYIADPVEAIGMLDVVISLSEVAESFGRSLVEAMAARRPVVAYRWGATPELIRDGQDGFLVPYLDVMQVLERLVMLADRPELVRQMGQSGRAHVARTFSQAELSSQLNAIYGRILDIPS